MDKNIDKLLSEQAQIRNQEKFDSFINEAKKQSKPKIKKGGNYINLKTLGNGNLEVSLDKKADKEEIQELIDVHGYQAFDVMFEDINTNSSLDYFESADQIGQMSDASVITLDIDLTDSGDYEFNEDTYLFVYEDSYRYNPAEELLERGKIIFKWNPINESFINEIPTVSEALTSAEKVDKMKIIKNFRKLGFSDKDIKKILTINSGEEAILNSVMSEAKEVGSSDHGTTFDTEERTVNKKVLAFIKEKLPNVGDLEKESQGARRILDTDGNSLGHVEMQKNAKTRTIHVYIKADAMSESQITEDKSKVTWDVKRLVSSLKKSDGLLWYGIHYAFMMAMQNANQHGIYKDIENALSSMKQPKDLSGKYGKFFKQLIDDFGVSMSNKGKFDADNIHQGFIDGVSGVDKELAQNLTKLFYAEDEIGESKIYEASKEGKGNLDISDVKVSKHNGTLYKSVVITSGKSKYSFLEAVGKFNYISVTKESANPFGGKIGTDFKSWDEAQEKYKSPLVKNMILLAEDSIKRSPNKVNQVIEESSNDVRISESTEIQSDETKALNKKLEIKKLKEAKFIADAKKGSFYKITGDVLYIDGKGYISFDGKTPYQPVGGNKALKEIISQGGMVDYTSDITFVKPMGDMKVDEGSQEDYQKFFKDELEKYGVKSPAELSKEDITKFFDGIKKGWSNLSEGQYYETLNRVLEGSQEEYQKFFKSELEKYGVKSPAELSKEDIGKFFDGIKSGWSNLKG